MLVLYNRDQKTRPYGETNWMPTFIIGKKKPGFWGKLRERLKKTWRFIARKK